MGHRQGKETGEEGSDIDEYEAKWKEEPMIKVDGGKLSASLEGKGNM